MGMFASGCLHFKHSQYQAELQADTARRLYEPITKGEQALLETLAYADYTQHQYNLSASQVTSANTDASINTAWNESQCVFFQLSAEEKATKGTRWIYLSPRTLSVFELGKPLPADCDLVQTDEHRYSVFRSIPIPGSAKENLEIFRFDFAVDAESAPVFDEPIRTTISTGADYQPVPIANGTYVVYMNREGSKKNAKLMLAASDGSYQGPVWPDQTFDVRLPRILPDGRLVVAANPDGYFRLHYVTFSQQDKSAQLEAAPYPLPAPTQNASVTFAMSVTEGTIRPTLLKLPVELNLETISAMVMASNGSVNQRRAELAAAVIEAGTAKLAYWPVITFGLEYERNSAIFVTKPELYPADLFTTGITRGVLGLVQPLLDFRHNYAISKADEWRAEVLRDVLENEINDRMTEAAEFYFEALYLKHRVELESYWIRVARRRLDYYKTLRQEGEAYRLQVIAAGQVIENLDQESQFHADRYAFLLKKITHLCGYPESAVFELADARHLFNDAVVPSESEMRDTALLNHPAMRMAEHSLSEAYYLSETEADIRPQATLLGSMELGGREFDRLVTTTAQVGDQTLSSTSTEQESRKEETSILGLSAAIPLASLKARRLHAYRHALNIEALELEKESMARTIAADAEEAYTDFRASQKDYIAKMASVSYFLEQLRLARVLKEHGLPENMLEVPLIRKDLAEIKTIAQPASLSGNQNRVDTPLSNQVLSDVTAETEYLGALANLLEVERDLSVRYVRLWREMGIAQQIPAQVARWSREEQGRYMTSSWMWYTRRVIESDESMERWVGKAVKTGIRRIYAYLEVDSRLLNDLVLREKFRHFVNLCFKYGIEVWGLLGEPEWMAPDADTGQLVRGMDRILDFNAKAGEMDPRIEGVKLDLEPHSLSEWNRDLVTHANLIERYIKLIATAHGRAAGVLPVWVDCPPKFFNLDNIGIVDALSPYIDGLTLMCYFNSENAIRKHANIAFEKYAGPIEVGIELSDKSPAQECVRDWPKARLDTFLSAFREESMSHACFAGVAFHDIDAAVAYQEENES